MFVDLPDAEARLKILQVHLEGEPMNLKDSHFKRLATRTKGFSGSDLSSLCREALMVRTQRSKVIAQSHTQSSSKQVPVRECMRATHFKKIRVKGRQKFVPARPNDWGAIKMNMSQLSGDQLHCRALRFNDFEIALSRVKATVSASELKQYETFAEEFGGGKLHKSIAEQRRKDREEEERRRQRWKESQETEGFLGRISSWLFSTRQEDDDARRRREEKRRAPPPPVPKRRGGGDERVMIPS